MDHYLIIDPGDIKSEHQQQQPGSLSIATSRAQTIGEITPDMKHPKTSTIYWTGLGMSINRVISGSTKKQQNRHSQERINCLKIDKRHQWVKYVTKQKNHNGRYIPQEPIKEDEDKLTKIIN
jgi:hypothetical protein